MDALFSIEDARGDDALFSRDIVPDIPLPTTRVGLSCPCGQRTTVTIDNRADRALTLWKLTGWQETTNGARCPNCRPTTTTLPAPADGMLL